MNIKVILASIIVTYLSLSTIQKYRKNQEKKKEIFIKTLLIILWSTHVIELINYLK